jgi:hypothetical protein
MREKDVHYEQCRHVKYDAGAEYPPARAPPENSHQKEQFAEQNNPNCVW